MDRPILFSGPMVRAILAGTKCQTRRLVTRATSSCGAPWGWLRFGEAYPTTSQETLLVPGHHPRYVGDGAVHQVRARWMVGDLLWVRETWAHHSEHGPACVQYRADVRDDSARICGPWRPSIFLPRWASRLQLLVLGVRVERLQRITGEDAVAEGCVCGSQREGMFTARDSFARLWDEINGERAAWAVDPWVWVLSFDRVASDEVVARG